MTLPRSVWLVVADRCGVAVELAAQLAAQNQAVVVASAESPTDGASAVDERGFARRAVDMLQRESWRSLVEDLPADVPLGGVVHLAALDGHGSHATTGEMAQDTRRVAASALALVQGLADADAATASGVWFVTRGAQVLERERGGELAGATLWGFGKVVSREAPHLQARMIDLDPEGPISAADLASELLSPDAEDHIAYRAGRRQVARLVRAGATAGRLALPAGSDWVLAPDPEGALDNLYSKPRPEISLEPKEVRVEVEARGLNFQDVLRGDTRHWRGAPRRGAMRPDRPRSAPR